MKSDEVPQDIEESWLSGVETDAQRKDALLNFSKGGRRWQMSASGVQRILIEEFLEQNVVEEIVLFDTNSKAEAYPDLLAQLLFRRETASELAEPEFKTVHDATMRQIQAGELLLLQVRPVYGASVLVLAEDIRWTLL